MRCIIIYKAEPSLWNVECLWNVPSRVLRLQIAAGEVYIGTSKERTLWEWHFVLSSEVILISEVQYNGVVYNVCASVCKIVSCVFSMALVHQKYFVYLAVTSSRSNSLKFLCCSFLWLLHEFISTLRQHMRALRSCEMIGANFSIDDCVSHQLFYNFSHCNKYLSV